MENIFAEGTRKKVRFSHAAGDLSIERLWELKIDKSDDKNYLYKLETSLIEELESFGKTTRREVPIKNKQKELVELKLSIVTYVIDTLLKEQEEAAEKLDNKKSNEPILEVILEKEKEELKNKSVEELKAMLKK